MTLAQIASLAIDPTFVSTVTAGAASYAATVIAEPTTTVNHPARLAWALAFLRNPGNVGTPIVWSVAVDPTITTSYTDTLVLAAVGNAWNGIAGTGA